MILMDEIRKILTEKKEGKRKIRGWLHGKRTIGGVLFFLIRDGTSIMQATLKKERIKDFEQFDKLPIESVVAIEGEVRKDQRAPGGFELVAEQGLVWDLLLYDEQLPAAHELIGSFPDTSIVLEAVGWPLDQSPVGFQRWEERLQAVSEFPNLTLKFQGVGLLFGANVDRLRRWVATAVRIFGAQRCMFASHFPVDRLVCGFDELVDILLAILSDLSAEEHSAFFSGCATQQYGLP